MSQKDRITMYITQEDKNKIKKMANFCNTNMTGIMFKALSLFELYLQTIENKGKFLIVEKNNKEREILLK